MKKCSCRESNSGLLIESTVSYPVDHQDNDTGRCNFLVTRDPTDPILDAGSAQGRLMG